MLKELRGSDVIIECLLEQGVDTVFGYPGGAVLNIYDSLYKYSDKIHHVITAHEQAACHAADGYSRTTGRRYEPCNRYRHSLYGFYPYGGYHRKRNKRSAWS